VYTQNVQGRIQNNTHTHTHAHTHADGSLHVVFSRLEKKVQARLCTHGMLTSYFGEASMSEKEVQGSR
jgi:hypothetical protein